MKHTNRYLGIVDADSILYRVAYVTEDDSFEIAKDTLRAFIYQQVYSPTRCKAYIFCFSGEKNFRKEIADYYKDNRKDFVKPKHLEGLKKYAIEEFNGLLIEPYEADDLVIAIADRYAGDFVLIGIDKDAYQLAGTHYNFVKGEFKEVSPLQSQFNFAMQMLMGDNVDNIKGIQGIGKVKAAKLLDVDKPPMEVVYDVYDNLGLVENGYYKEQYQLLRMKKDIIIDGIEKHFLCMTFEKGCVNVEEFDF